MSYRKNLGRVKGEPGQIYQPVVYTDTNNKKRKIKWELKEQSEATTPEEIDITPTFYKPILTTDTNTGNVTISFESVTSTDNPLTITGTNIKGPKGDDGVFDTVVCVSGFPTVNEAEEGKIYIYQGSAKAYDATTNQLYFVEDLGKFNSYQTIAAATQMKTDIENAFNLKIGNVEDCQKAIMQKLGQSVNIPDGD